jgi:hypothetical protein
MIDQWELYYKLEGEINDLLRGGGEEPLESSPHLKQRATTVQVITVLEVLCKRIADLENDVERLERNSGEVPL